MILISQKKPMQILLYQTYYNNCGGVKLISQETKVRQRYADSVFDKIITLIKYGIWPNVNQEKFNRWKAQFKNINDKYYAAYLAQKLIYYNIKDFSCLIRWSFTKAIKEITLSENSIHEINDDVWEEKIEEVYNNTLVCPLAAVDDPTASGNMVTRLMRNQGICLENNICTAENLVNYLKDNSYYAIIFVDDMIGSGNQARDFYLKTLIGDKTIKNILDTYNIPSYLVVAVASKESLNIIEQETNFKVICSELLGKENCTFNKEFWHKDEFQEGKDFFRQLNVKYGIGQGGYKNKSWCIAFEHGVPNVTSPFYWLEKDNYIPLIPKRGVDI